VKFPKDVAQIPDIFINVYSSLMKTRIAYIRMKVQDVLEQGSFKFIKASM
jgi:hypothetical protein